MISTMTFKSWIRKLINFYVMMFYPWIHTIIESVRPVERVDFSLDQPNKLTLEFHNRETIGPAVIVLLNQTPIILDHLPLSTHLLITFRMNFYKSISTRRLTLLHPHPQPSLLQTNRTTFSSLDPVRELHSVTSMRTV
jgi:uncharacterized membrane protein